MSRNEKQGKTSQRAEEILEVFKKGAQLTRELLQENHHLRCQLAQSQHEGDCASVDGLDGEELQRLKTQIANLQREKQEMRDRIERVEAENNDFANRYVEIEAENNSLANLYIATCQLHSTLDFREVLQVVSEVIINLIGGEQFAVFLLDENAASLYGVAAEGVELEQLPSYALGEGQVGVTAQEGESFFADSFETRDHFLAAPLACIPLKIDRQVIGVIAVYRLFLQKNRFTEIDYELFTLLAGHAASAIFASKLYSDSKRKLSTIEGFLNLLTK